MNPKEILTQAKAAQPKIRLEEYQETVDILREKGYTWREVADFLKERGVEIDHTRIYRAFARKPKHRHKESREVQISRVTFMGVRKSKKNNSWNVMELLLPSKLGEPVTVLGYAWGKAGTHYILNVDDTMRYRNSSLVIKSGEGTPLSYIILELQVEGDQWIEQEVYIMPKWELLI